MPGWRDGAAREGGPRDRSMDRRGQPHAKAGGETELKRTISWIVSKCGHLGLRLRIGFSSQVSPRHCLREREEGSLGGVKTEKQLHSSCNCAVCSVPHPHRMCPKKCRPGSEWTSQRPGRLAEPAGG